MHKLWRSLYLIKKLLHLSDPCSVFCVNNFQPIIIFQSTKKYFEIDDKDFYRSKIKFIEENDPEDLTLVFAEEEYDQQGLLEKVG